MCARSADNSVVFTLIIALSLAVARPQWHESTWLGEVSYVMPNVGHTYIVGYDLFLIVCRHMSVLSNVDNTHICIYTERVKGIRFNICGSLPVLGTPGYYVH